MRSGRIPFSFGGEVAVGGGAEMSARSAASGIDGCRPSRTSSVAACRRATRVRAFRFARPEVVREAS